MHVPIAANNIIVVAVPSCEFRGRASRETLRDITHRWSCVSSHFPHMSIMPRRCIGAQLGSFPVKESCELDLPSVGSHSIDHLVPVLDTGHVGFGDVCIRAFVHYPAEGRGHAHPTLWGTIDGHKCHLHVCTSPSPTLELHRMAPNTGRWPLFLSSHLHLTSCHVYQIPDL